MASALCPEKADSNKPPRNANIVDFILSFWFGFFGDGLGDRRSPPRSFASLVGEGAVGGDLVVAGCSEAGVL